MCKYTIITANSRTATTLPVDRSSNFHHKLLVEKTFFLMLPDRKIIISL